jgi:hypothetical protein
MKSIVAVCLVLISVSSGSFEEANRVGDPNARNFFLFSTAAGNYTIRQDGMGEVATPKGMRRVFMLKLGMKGRLERVCFGEHEGDLLLFYELQDGRAYLLRMNQQNRKFRWLTDLREHTDHDPAEFQLPVIQGDLVIFTDAQGRRIEVNKAGGTVVRAQ